ncbi:MAG TPA: Dabb family protein [Caulifigura sp.]|nr:Dabb family protein [Caulifigura sp.]
MSRLAVSLSLVLVCTIAIMSVSTTAAPDSPRVLRHVVLFKFKPDAAKDKVQAVVDAFGKLPKQIDVIKDFEMGTDNSPELKSKGFTHCFVVTFADEKGRETYLPHPAHKEFVTLLGPVLEDVLVVDYWTK